MIAGFEAPSEGKILLEGQDVSRLAPYQRDVNTVFQDYALFPHMTVAENVEYGLRVKKVPKDERRTRVNEALAMVQLSAFGERKPAQLSGGQRQRVALARALVNRPKVLLLDEPLGALDLKLRQAMQIELKEIQQSVGLTFIYVTHDQEEALTMSDRLAVFNHGRIEQVGRRPRSTSARRRDSSPGSSASRTSWRAAAAQQIAGDEQAFTIRPEKIALREPDAGGPRRVLGIRARARGRIPGCRHPVHRAARRGGRAGRDAAEPHDVVDGGVAGARQGRAPGVGTEEQPSGRSGRKGLTRVHGSRGGGTDEESDPERSPPRAVLMLLAAACGGGNDNNGGSSGGGGGSTGPTAIDTIGATEGQLNLIAWPGYTEKGWVKPFETETGCQVTVKYGNTSDEMVNLMRQGGGTAYDGVSASGDATNRLIAAGDVAAVDVTKLFPDYANVMPSLQAPAHNTVNGVHYGVPYMWGPNFLMYNTDVVTTAADELGLGLRDHAQRSAEPVRRQRHRLRQPHLHRRRGAVSEGAQPGLRASPIRTS